MAKPGGQQAARDFYHGILEMEEVTLPAELRGRSDLLWFGFLDATIHLSFTENFVASPVGRHICLEVSNLLALKSRLEASGYSLEHQIQLADRHRFFIPDPFGNYFELMEYKTDAVAAAPSSPDSAGCG